MSTLPSEIVDHAVNAAIAAASGLATRDRSSARRPWPALVLSGVAMVVAGSSSPASGGEHLLSHLWDMERLSQGDETRLHGAQVGVTTCITAALYQRLLETDSIEVNPPNEWAFEAARIQREHGELAPVILEQFRRKHARTQARIQVLQTRWDEIRAGLRARSLPTPAEIRAALIEAGAPNTLDDLEEPRENAARVFRLARDIRDRVTVLDVGFELGILPDAIDELLAESGV